MYKVSAVIGPRIFFETEPELELLCLPQPLLQQTRSVLGWQNVKRALKGQLYSQQFYSDFGFDTNLIIQHRSAVAVDHQCPSFLLTQSCEMLQNVTHLSSE